MQSNAAVENEETVRQIRFGPFTNRPFSPPQPLWRDPLPEGVKQIKTRAALDKYRREYYAKWASNFALLTDEFIAQVGQGALDRLAQLSRWKWRSFQFVDWHFCQVGDNFLWVQEHDGGWTVELCYPDVDPDARILTVENMPVLCPDGPSAAWLAWACYPEPPANLVWHSYW